jgi:hypothetical protein
MHRVNDLGQALDSAMTLMRHPDKEHGETALLSLRVSLTASLPAWLVQRSWPRVRYPDHALPLQPPGQRRDEAVGIDLVIIDMG